MLKQDQSSITINEKFDITLIVYLKIKFNEYLKMIKQNSLSHHRRNKSQLMTSLPSHLPKTKKKSNQPNNNNRKKTPSNVKKGNSSLINTLLNKSTKKVNRKQILVQDIDQVVQDEGSDDFFCFGKGYACTKLRQVEPQMEEIVEVPDTGSFSQRNTDQDHRNSSHPNHSRQNKQNLKQVLNYPQIQDKFFRLSKNHQRGLVNNDNTTVAIHSYRQINNGSGRSSNHSQRSDCSQTHSTIDLSRQKSKPSRSKSRGRHQSQKNEIKMLKDKTAKMQKSIKMIWECMGQIWQNNRANKQIIQRNNDSISDISSKVVQTEKMLLQLKLDLGKKNKDASQRI